LGSHKARAPLEAGAASWELTPRFMPPLPAFALVWLSKLRNPSLEVPESTHLRSLTAIVQWVYTACHFDHTDF